MNEQVLAAINALYHNDSSELKSQANKWLEQWQESETAWMQADALLHNPETPIDALWFCAQTLRTKVQRHFHQLPGTAVESLRDSLMNLLLKHAKGHPPVRTQLCLALASLGVHLDRTHWGDKGIVIWLATALSRAPQDLAQPCMLELLHVLPQEAGSQKVAVRPARRREFVAELEAVASDALDVLTSCTGQAWREGVLEAFCSWLKLAGHSLSGAHLQQHHLVRFAMEALASPDCFEKAVDVMCELIFLTVDPSGGAIKPDMLPLVHLIFPAVMALRPRFLLARQRAEAASEGKEDDVEDEFDDDEETVKGMARLFAEVGEAYAPFISQGSSEAAGPVEALLEVTAYPDMSISSIALNFWNRLTRNLLPRDAPPADPARLQLFAPAYERLVNIIRVRSRYPENWITLTKGEQRDFRRGRSDMEEALLYASEVLGPERSLALVAAFLEEAQRDGGGVPWRLVEAGLFCTGALFQNPVPPGHPQLVQVLRAMCERFAEDTLLATPCCFLTISYASWLSRSIAAGSPACAELLPPLLRLAIAHCSTADATEAAAHCVARLCEECGAYMAPCLEPLLALYQKALGAGATRQLTGQADNGVPLLEEDVLLIVRGATHAVCSSSAPEQMTAAVGWVANPLVTQIQQAMQRVGEEMDSGVGLSTQHPFLLPQFDRLATLFQSIPHPALVAQLLASCWPLFDAALSKAGRDEKAVERLLRGLRHGLKHSGKAAGAMLPLLLQVLPAGFQRTSLPAYMYVVSELVKVFGDDPAHDPSMGPIVKQLLAASCTSLQSLPQLQAAPDLVDDTFILASRSLHYCPRLILLEPQLLQLLLETSMVGLLLEHREACGSVVGFICRLLDPLVVHACAANAAAAQNLLQAALGPRGQDLTKLLLAGVAGAQQVGVRDICDVFIALLKRLPEPAMAWLVEGVKMLPSPAVQQQDVERLVGAAQVVARGGGLADQRSLEDGLFELAEVCNLSPKSREACLQALLPQQLVAAVLRQ